MLEVVILIKYDLPNKVCVPNKTEELNLSVFNIITGINKSKKLYHANANVILMEENIIQINGGITTDIDVSVLKSSCMWDYYWNPVTCSCENRKYLASIIDDSAITCEEIIESYEEETKTTLTNSNEKNIICKRQNFYILLTFLLITIALLTAVSIYCYLIKYRVKQKQLLPFDVTNNKLKQVLHW